MTYRTRPAVRRSLAVLSCTALALLSGCAGDTAFPSLAPRPIETIARQPERTETAPAPAADPALDARVAALEADLRSAVSDWSAAAAITRGAVGRARGAAVGSNAWIAAQQQVSRLEVIRERTATTTEALDRLRVAQAESARPADTARLDRALAAAVAQGKAQDATFTTLSTALPGA
ncbi:hypothetical protein [Sphingomonas montana]|uniref:hypothetical protein n=1 Tax=Sphingomonas montana TaxID=1843236 RepID=UPI00096F1186|nr:hypothetical protein [Sphingomonas montana]